MMLFLDTSDPEQTSLFLLGDNAARAHVFKSKKDQSEKLTDQIHRFLNKYKVKLSKLEKIGVVTGPGFFSRIRTGVVTANTLAYALNIPVVPVKKLGTGINFSAVLKQKGQKSVQVFYDRAPNITKPKSKK
jgi:tRNA threonylcarbamoyl adenosine modification protein YeaZ